MAKKSKISKSNKSKRNAKALESVSVDDLSIESEKVMPQENYGNSIKTVKKSTKIITAAVIVVIILLFLIRKGYIVSAVVNGRPVFRWEVSKVLFDRYGTQTLETLISKRLVEQQARSSTIVVTSEDIQKRQKEMLDRIGGGITLEDILKYQGISRAEFDEQLKLNITLEKILGRDVNITQDDIDLFIATNSASFTATDPAELNTQVRQAILDQKVGEMIRPWFEQIQSQAKIIKF